MSRRLDSEVPVEAVLDKYLGDLRLDRQDAQALTLTEEDLVADCPIRNDEALAESGFNAVFNVEPTGP